jgi:hypothetical protein
MLSLTLVATVALGPSALPTDVWEADWIARATQTGLTPTLMAEWRQLKALDPTWTEPEPIQPVAANNSVSLEGVEQWRWLVAQHFKPEDVETALAIMACESGGNPTAENPTSTATGLFQHLRGWWSGEWGLDAFDPFDPAQSVAAAAALRYGRGNWNDWRASEWCRNNN